MLFRSRGTGDGERAQRFLAGEALARPDHLPGGSLMTGADAPQGEKRIIRDVVGGGGERNPEIEDVTVRHHHVAATGFGEILVAALPQEIDRDGGHVEAEALQRLQDRLSSFPLRDL